MSVRVRFAPSPTGSLHLGTARTAVVNWLFARSRGGELILRFDDTDRERSTEQSATELLTDLEWLGIDWDEGPLLQSERQGSYEAALAELDGAELTYIDDGATYMRVPGGEPLAFDDLLRGRIEFPAGSKDDFVIRRSDGSFTYNFATAIDDSEMDITHVIRGEDHISNTPLQVLVIAGTGKTPPQYLHLPLLLAGDGSKLSKRLGAVSVAEYRDEGYLREAIINYLSLTIFTPDEEVLPPSKLVAQFSIEKLHRSPAKFDAEKLAWISRAQMIGLGWDGVSERLDQFVTGHDVDLALFGGQTAYDLVCRAGVTTLKELADGLMQMYREPQYDRSAENALLKDEASEALRVMRDALDEMLKGVYRLDENTSKELIDNAKRGLKEKSISVKIGLTAVRSALIGSASGYELAPLIAILDHKRTRDRIDKALRWIADVQDVRQ